jgi:hypothetical protein
VAAATQVRILVTAILAFLLAKGLGGIIFFDIFQNYHLLCGIESYIEVLQNSLYENISSVEVVLRLYKVFNTHLQM